MPGRPQVRDGQADCRGGLNTAAAADQLGQNELRRADNAHLTEFGGASKRRGTQRTHAAAIGSGNPVRGGYSWQQAASTQQLAVSNGLLHTGTYSIGMTWTARAGALSSTAQIGFAHFRDGSGEAAYIADGGPLNKWDGATHTVNIASTPNLARVWVYNGRLYGVTGIDQTLHYSALNNGDSCGVVAGGGGAQIVRSFGAQSLVGGMALGASNILFHREGVSRWTGWTQDDITVDPRAISAEVGTIAPGSLVQVENVGFFLSDRGFYQVTESGVTPISEKIEPTIAALSHANFSRVVAAHHRARREVLWYLPDVGVYAFNYRLGAWSGPWDGAFTASGKTPYAMWPALDASGNPIVLWGGQDGFVRHLEPDAVYLDDVLSDGSAGSAFTLTVKQRRFYFGSVTRTKSVRRLFVTGEPRGSTGASVRWQTNSATGTASLSNVGASSWGTGTWGLGTGLWGGTGAVTQDVQGHGRGPFVDVNIVDNGSAESLWTGVVVQAFDLGERGE